VFPPAAAVRFNPERTLGQALGQGEKLDMARKINRLNALSAKRLKKFGRHADGDGLYLSISSNGGRRWTFLYRWHGKPTELGFGSARVVTLAKARELATAARAMLQEGVNPKGARAAAVGATFGECADRYIEDMRPAWRSTKHASQWQTTVMGRVADKTSKTGWRAAEVDYCASLRRLPVDKIATDDVLSVLRPLWNTKPETASRVRGRIENVLDAAKARGLRAGDNPARWRGHLDQLLPRRQRIAQPHYAAMAYDEVPSFMGDLQARESVAARCLEFCILTAARSGEALGVTWAELDLDRGIWTVPAGRMKAGQEHRVPLSDRALAIVRALHEVRRGEHVFPGQGTRARISLGARALGGILERMKIEGATPHGFRSSFRDWAAEQTSFPSDVCEMALAHVIANKVEAAYCRGDLFEKRRELMAAWERYCTGKAGKIVQFAGREVLAIGGYGYNLK
jgi:integrase